MRNFSSMDKFPLSRRQAVQSGLGGVVGLAGLKSWSALGNTPPSRLAIIGSGMGGLATSYFCAPDWSIDLFEAAPKVGGHADTIQLEEDGQALSVDIGAQFFHPETHPLYLALLSHLNLEQAVVQGRPLLLEIPASLSIFAAKGQQTFLSSQHPLDHIANGLAFAIFSQAARLLVSSSDDWETSLGTWVDQLPLAGGFKDKVLLPWLASLSCANVELVRRQSARSHLTPFAKSFPANPLQGAKTYNATVGLGGILQLLHTRSPGVKTYTDAAVVDVQEVDGQWFVMTRDARHGPYAAVVVNAPPYASQEFLKNLPWAEEVRTLLGQQEYYRSRLIVHRDPVYMPPHRKDWSVQNAAIDGENCEGSVWMGAIYKPEPQRAPLSLFKSWASWRQKESKAILWEREFKHCLSTPETMRAIKQLQNWQGVRGLYFAGHSMTCTDLQETALFSALDVARRLSPESPRLRRFEAQLEGEGLSDIDYSMVGR